MSFEHPRVINCPASPNHGVQVLADYDRQGWDATKDAWSDDWVSVMIGTDTKTGGRVGTIEKKYLDVPVTLDLSKETP